MDLIGFIEKGGIIMYPIILCSIISLAVFFERLWVTQEKKVIPSSFFRPLMHLVEKKDWNQAEILCSENGSSFANIILAGLKKRDRKREIIKESLEDAGEIEVSYLEKHVGIMGIIATIAPLLGLLGTITGMLKVFAVIAEQQNPQIGMLAKGIWEALITTAAGLPVAIVSYLCYSYIISRIENLSKKMEEFSLNILNEIDYEKEKKD